MVHLQLLPPHLDAQHATLRRATLPPQQDTYRLHHRLPPQQLLLLDPRLRPLLPPRPPRPPRLPAQLFPRDAHVGRETMTTLCSCGVAGQG